MFKYLGNPVDIFNMRKIKAVAKKLLKHLATERVCIRIRKYEL